MITLSHTFGKRLIDALGIKDETVFRVVLDVKINDAVKVYVSRALDSSKADDIIQAIIEDQPIVVEDNGPKTASCIRCYGNGFIRNAMSGSLKDYKCHVCNGTGVTR